MARKKKIEDIEEITEIPLVTEESTDIKPESKTCEFDMAGVWNMLIRNKQARDIISYIVRTSNNDVVFEKINKLPKKSTELVLECLGIISTDSQKFFIQQLAKECSLISSINRTNRIFNKTANPSDSYDKILADLA